MFPNGKEKTRIEPGLKIVVQGRTYVARHGSVLGREGTLAVSYFEQFNTVSRVHAKISKQGGRWFITIPAAVANSTMLDGVELKRDVAHPLLGEHVLKMSDQCVVRVIA